MIARSSRIFLEVVLGTLIGFALLGAVSAWRLAQGPVSLTFLTPSIQEALAELDLGVRFAIGDTVGKPMLAHKASHEGRVAAEAFAGHNVAFEPRVTPAVVFTDPEVAWCGLTETQAKS